MEETMNKDILENVQRGFNEALFEVKKQSPVILLCVGVAGFVATTVLACKATKKVDKVVEENKQKIEDAHKAVEAIEDVKSPEYKEAKKELTKDYISFGWEMTKLYGPSVVCGVASTACVFGSNDIMRRRNAEMAAAVTTVSAMFGKYRKNVVETFGADVDRDMRYGIKTKEITTTETLKNGKEKTKTEQVDVVLDEVGLSEFAIFFDESCKKFTQDPVFNKMFLEAKQKEANYKLVSHGYLFLNDVYEMLGHKKTKAGAVMGWLYRPDDPNHCGDNYVDFFTMDAVRNKRFEDGLETVALLDFNVDNTPIVYNIEFKD